MTASFYNSFPFLYCCFGFIFTLKLYVMYIILNDAQFQQLSVLLNFILFSIYKIN